jgi:hypothetical protein
VPNGATVFKVVSGSTGEQSPIYGLMLVLMLMLMLKLMLKLMPVRNTAI